MTEYIVIPRNVFMEGFQCARGKVTEWFLKQLDTCDTIVSDDESQDTAASQQECDATEEVSTPRSSPIKKEPESLSMLKNLRPETLKTCEIILTKKKK